MPGEVPQRSLRGKLCRDVQPRREEIWFAISGLVPQTVLLQGLQRRQPG